MGECFLDAEEVEGSIPSAPTNYRMCIQEEKLKRDVALPTMLNIYRF